VGYLKKVNLGLTQRFSFTELIGEIATSGFVGVLTFYLCEEAGFSQLVTAAFVGITGHMGSRAIFHIETYLKNKFR